MVDLLKYNQANHSMKQCLKDTQFHDKWFTDMQCTGA